MKPSAIVINLTPINETSTLINPSIAMFIAETLKLPALYKEADIRAATGAEVVIVVNGLGQFCKARGAIGDAIARCKKFVWVMNDYRVQFPRPHSEGSSEILDGVRRGMTKGMEFSYWATVPKVLTTPTSRYCNWNAIAYRPERMEMPPPKASRKIIYYGALRPKREETFKHYFTHPGLDDLPVVVAAPERQHQNWIDHGLATNIELIQALPRPIEPELQKFAMGLYLQDTVPYYESPASRFYELLGAQVPIIFQPEAVNKLAGDTGNDYDYAQKNVLPLLDVSRYVVDGQDDYARLLRKRAAICEAQHQEWGRANHREVLRDRVKKVWSELLRRTAKNTGGGCQSASARRGILAGG